MTDYVVELYNPNGIPRDPPNRPTPAKGSETKEASARTTEEEYEDDDEEEVDEEADADDDESDPNVGEHELGSTTSDDDRLAQLSIEGLLQAHFAEIDANIDYELSTDHADHSAASVTTEEAEF